MKQRIIVALLVLAAAGAALFFIMRTGAGLDPGSLEASGTIEVTEVNVAFKTSGRVMQLFSDEGRTVKKGEQLASLDRDERASQVAQNRAAVRSAEVLLKKAKQDLDRFEALHAQEAVSSQQLDAARAAHDTAVAQTQFAAAALRTSETRLADTVLFASAAGIVLRKNIEEGETVAAGVPVFTIGSLEDPWVKVYVREDKLGLVKLGQKARIRTDSRPAKEYDGVITFISSEAEFTPKNVQTREERVKLVFAVKVKVRNEDQELKPGMPADVRILLK